MPPVDPSAASADRAQTQPQASEPALISRWLEEGRYAEAAAALRAQGKLEAAQELLERIWDYASALAVATERNDLIAQLRLSLLSGNLDALSRLRPALAGAPAALRQRAAATLEQHQQAAAAAELYESAGAEEEALRCYDLAGDYLGSARLHKRRGELGAALRDYEHLLAAGPETADRAQQTHAHLGLGCILQQLGRHEEAVRHLQQARAALSQALPASQARSAADSDAELDEIEVALVRSLSALGYPRVAQPILLSFTARHPEEPAAQTVAEFIIRHSPPPDSATPPSPPSPALPVVLGRYELVRLLGSGGMGRVYLAVDQQAGRQVALKLLPAHAVTAAPGAANPDAPAELWHRFVREAQLLRGLRHPNIVQLLDFHPEAAVLAMEYLPGGSLAQRPLPLPPATVRKVMLDVLAALAAAHAAGVLHRDLKPHNLLCSATGETRLGDFGAAYLQGLGMTRTESFIGTLAYMAPEQLSGQPLSFATDLYALAVTAFQLLTGRLPFPGPDFIGQHLRDAPPDPRGYVPLLDPGWSDVLLRALCKRPADRYASVEEMREAVLALPGLPDPSMAADETAAAARPPATAPAAPAGEPAGPERFWVEGASPVLQTPYSTVVLGLDVHLGRPVLVERFRSAEPRQDALAAQLRWLRGVARLAGPGLQRVLRIEQDAEQNLTVHYEAPVGPHAGPAAPLSAADARLLRRTLQRLHAAGIVHGAIAGAVVCEPAAAMLLVHGRGPLAWSPAAPPSAEEDLAQLERLFPPT